MLDKCREIKYLLIVAVFRKTDVIVVSTSSSILTDVVIQAAGDEVKTDYLMQSKSQAKSLIISTPSGRLPCKRIFFLNWICVNNKHLLRQSIIDLISNVVRYVTPYHFTSIAFSAIGCDVYSSSANIIIRTMVFEMKKQLLAQNVQLRIKFVISPEQIETYGAFCREVLTPYEGNYDFIETQTVNFCPNCLATNVSGQPPLLSIIDLTYENAS